MIVRCCECKKIMGFKPGKGESHGICDESMKKNHPDAWRFGRDQEAMRRGAEAFARGREAQIQRLTDMVTK